MRNKYLFILIFLLLNSCSLFFKEAPLSIKENPDIIEDEVNLISVQSTEITADLDLLFVIDDSYSMKASQNSLREAILEMVNERLANPSAQNPIQQYCLGIITTSSYLHNNEVGPKSCAADHPAAYTNTALVLEAEKEIVFDENSNPVLDENGNVKTKIKNILGKGRKVCSHLLNGSKKSLDILKEEVNHAFDTVSTCGHSSEKPISSLNKFLDIENNPPVVGTPFFRKGTFRGVIIISDEDEQTFANNSEYINKVKNFLNKIKDKFNDLDQFLLNSKDYYFVNIYRNPYKMFDVSTLPPEERDTVEFPRFDLFTSEIVSQDKGEYYPISHKGKVVTKFTNVLDELIRKVETSLKFKGAKIILPHPAILGSVRVEIYEKGNFIKSLESNQFQVSNENEVLITAADQLREYSNSVDFQIKVKYKFKVFPVQNI